MSFCLFYDINKTTHCRPPKHQKGRDRRQKKTHGRPFAEEHAQGSGQTRRESRAQQASVPLIPPSLLSQTIEAAWIAKTGRDTPVGAFQRRRVGHGLPRVRIVYGWRVLQFVAHRIGRPA